MTYWTNAAVTFTADDPVHAHTTRKVLQDNMQTVIEQSGYDHECWTIDADKLDCAVANTWTWMDEIEPIVVPVYPAQGGGWREYKITALLQDTVGPITVRFFFLDSPVRPTIDTATGEVEGVTAYDDESVNGYARYTFTITPDQIGGVIADGVLLCFVYLHIAAVVGAGADTLSVYTIRIQEQY